MMTLLTIVAGMMVLAIVVLIKAVSIIRELEEERDAYKFSSEIAQRMYEELKNKKYE